MILIAASLLPVVLLMAYFYYRDKFEKEPVKVLMKAFGAGILSVFPAILLATLMSLPDIETYSPVTRSFIRAFCEAAVPEEICKFALLYFFIWRDRNFNEYYDGIIYAVFVSLGFAGVENIMYVVGEGIDVALTRGLLSVPLHALCGVIMGYYFSLARFNTARQKGYLLKAVAGAILAHGLYDFILFYTDSLVGISSAFAGLGFLLVFVFIIYLWQFSLRKIRLHVDNSAFKNQANEDEV